jgi:hypothetical protein
MQHPLVATLVWLLLIAAVMVAAGWIILHWFALGLAVGSAAANRFLLQALAVVAVIAVVVGAGWYWWRKSQKMVP